MVVSSAYALNSWPRDALQKGTQLHGYLIDGILGRGGFGVTYRATDAIDQIFAVKEYFPRQFAVRNGQDVLPAEEGEATLFADCLKRFTNEAKTLRRLSEVGAAAEGVVKVATFFPANGTAYLVMEYISGPSLRSLIDESPGGLPETLLRPLLTRLLHAVECVHEAGLLHRDIKPDNILLRGDGRPVLIDFGAVRAATRGQTVTFSQIFSKSYAPIEQFIGSRQGPYSDIYALGATLYRAIGGAPVDAFTRYQADLRGDRDPQIPAVEVGKGRYDAALLHAIDAAMSTAPESRPQSIKELEALLRERPAREGILAAPPEERTSQIEEVADLVHAWSGKAGMPRWAALDDVAAISERAVPELSRELPKPRSSRRKKIGLAIAAAVVVVGGLAAAGVHYAGFPLPGLALSGKPVADPGKPPVNPAEEIGQTIAAADLAYNEKRFAAAFSLYEQAAEHGDAKAQNRVGWFYEHGQGVAQDYGQAAIWYQKAADQGNAEAESNLGGLYNDGRGVRQDYAAAAAWYRKAADQGNPLAQNRLGNFYFTGRGVPQDLAEAAGWFRKAAEQGNADGQNNLGALYYSGRGVPQDDGEAATWFRKAAEQGNARAQSNLAGLYKNGRGVARDSGQAADWYRKAAEQGNATAESWLAALYEQGDGVPKNSATAMEWYKKAAEQGDADAQMKVVLLYATGGPGLQKDMTQARAAARKFADGGNKDAAAWASSHK